MGAFRYYEGGISSVYFWDLDHGFAGVILLKKSPYFLHINTHKTINYPSRYPQLTIKQRTFFLKK